jgi:hypothetical protein
MSSSTNFSAFSATSLLLLNQSKKLCFDWCHVIFALISLYAPNSLIGITLLLLLKTESSANFFFFFFFGCVDSIGFPENGHSPAFVVILVALAAGCYCVICITLFHKRIALARVVASAFWAVIVKCLAQVAQAWAP